VESDDCVIKTPADNQIGVKTLPVKQRILVVISAHRTYVAQVAGYCQESGTPVFKEKYRSH